MATDNKSVKPKEKESVYTIEQLQEAYKTFNASYALVTVALKMTGRNKFTFSEAQKIVDKFKEEVK